MNRTNFHFAHMFQAYAYGLSGRFSHWRNHCIPIKVAESIETEKREQLLGKMKQSIFTIRRVRTDDLGNAETCSMTSLPIWIR